jgi:uncharacterized protein (DUF2147 family)
MMKLKLFMAALAAAMGMVVAGPAAQADAPSAGVGPIAGVWRNPKNSVHIDIRACGQAICGYVVWATPKAIADAKEAGTPNLVGTQLLREFVRKGDAWRGKVFVPDMRATFSGSATLIDANNLRARGCLLAGVICKNQVWVRIS